MTTETTVVDDNMIGGNASAEGGEDDANAEDSSKSGCNIALANRLEEIKLDKKGFQGYIKVICISMRTCMYAEVEYTYKSGLE